MQLIHEEPEAHPIADWNLMKTLENFGRSTMGHDAFEFPQVTDDTQLKW